VPATYDDAGLIMQILRWGAEMGLEEGMCKIWGDDFDPQAANMEDPLVGRVMTWGEVIGTFVKQGVLDRGLVLDTWWMEGIWSRVGPAALRNRERMGEPRLFENLEALATAAG
jgi:hypothetical protein